MLKIIALALAAAAAPVAAVPLGVEQLAPKLAALLRAPPAAPAPAASLANRTFEHPHPS